jgi:hypothetical protein
MDSFERKSRRTVGSEIVARLSVDPLAESRNLKTLRPNPVALRELRIGSRSRARINVDEAAELMDVVVIGEKRGENSSSGEGSTRNTMKMIPIRETEANLEHYGALCRQVRVVVTVEGEPGFELAPLEEDDDLIDRLIETNPEFRAMLEARRHDRRLSAEEFLRSLDEEEAGPDSDSRRRDSK